MSQRNRPAHSFVAIADGRRRRGRGWWQSVACMMALLLAPLLASAGSGGESLPPHQMVWRQWAVPEGLPQVTVNDVLQDRAGYLWVATQDGVARFDGIDFRDYRPAEHPALDQGVIETLSLDGDGGLWMGSITGLSRFVDGRIVPVEVADGRPTGIVIGMQPHPAGGVWVSAEKGLFHAQGRTARWVGAGLPEQAMIAVLQPEEGPALAVGNLYLVVDPGGRREVIDLDGRVPPVMSAALEANGKLWLGTISGLYLTDRQARVQRVLAEGREILSVAQAPDGTVWFGSDEGLWHYRPGDDEARQVTVPGIDEQSWVRHVFVDREQNLWVGTQLSGLFRAFPDRFRRITARDGLVDDAVWSVYEAPDGEIWAGTTDGLYRGGLDGFHKEADADDLPHPAVLAVLRDRRGGLWVGTYDGLAHWSAGASRPERIEEVGDGSTAVLLEDDNGDILAGALWGLFRIRDGRVQRIELPGTAGGGAVNALARDNSGRLWVGYDAGAAYRDGDRWILADSPFDRPLSVSMLTPFGRDSMLASGFDGLFHLDAHHARRLGVSEGLHMGQVHSQLIGDRHVWYQSPLGVGRFPIGQLQALLRGERERMDVAVFGDLGAAHVAQCNGGHQAAGAITRGRWLWCPSLEGLLVLDLASIDGEAPPPSARLETLATPVRRVNLAASSTAVRLRSDERDIQIDFTGMYLRAPERLAFHGRLQGYDNQWQALGQRRTAYYTNLPAGDYTYELYAINEDGVRGPTTRMAFSIEPLWHETGVARAGGVILLLLLGWSVLHWRLRVLRRQRAMLEQRVQQRTAELERVNRKLEAASLTDPLTGLNNRRFLTAHLPHEIARVDRMHEEGRGADAMLAFLHIDLDRFKQINDRHGHQAGDQVLQIASGLLRESARGADFILRWGGEEFLLVGRDMRRDDIGAWADRIAEGFRRHVFQTDAGPLHVTCSIGHAAYPATGEARGALGWQGVLDMADAATYLAKREGRDRAVGFELLCADLPEDFAARLHAEPAQLAAEGWIRIVRGSGVAAGTRH